MAADVPVLTIDGPSGSGKGTVARQVAERLGWELLDSGALYRLVAYAAQSRSIPLDDEDAAAALAQGLDVRFGADSRGNEQIWLDGQEVSVAIRTEQAGDGASRVAAMPAVRKALVGRQKAFARPPGLVADGRDMGTTVFPAAQTKLFLTASAEARAERRYKQLVAKGDPVEMNSLIKDIQERDERDSNRAVSPLRPAEDAIVIDSTSMSIEQVFAEMLAAIGRRA